MLKNLLYSVGFSKVERTEIETMVVKQEDKEGNVKEVTVFKDPHQQDGQLCVNAYK